MPVPLTEDLILSLTTPFDPHLSPDGSRVAYVAAGDPTGGEAPRPAIWVAPTDGATMARRFTVGPGSDRHPRWSPDGRRLAFLSDRGAAGTFALYLIPLAGGEGSLRLRSTPGLASFAWSPDGRRIAFAAPGAMMPLDERSSARHEDVDRYGERWRYQRLQVLDCTTGETTVLPTGERQVGDYAWSPDGASIAFLARPTPELSSGDRTDLFVVAATGGTPPRHLCPTTGGASQLAWPGDGTHLIYVGGHDAVPQCESTVWAVAATGGAPYAIGPAIDEAAASWRAMAIPGRAGIATAVMHDLTTTLVAYDARSRRVTLHEDPGGDFGAFSVAMPASAAAPTLALVRSAGRTPPEVWVGTPDALHRISDHNAPLADVAFAVPEPFAWTAPDGMVLDGLLLRPPGAPATPLPMVTLLQYGPWTYGFQLGPLNWAQWLATHGYAVLLPNCRGGIGHGNAFATALRGDVGGVEYRDLMAAVDATVGREIADPARLGIGGWSQGGFMAAWAVTQTDRFTAAIIGAGVTDWRSMVLGSDLPHFQSVISGERPWDDADDRRANRRSPITHARRVATPLLILHGEEDRRVPVSQATSFARAVRERGTPVELVVYPGEGHGILARDHQRDVLSRVHAWYDRWLL